MKGTTYLGLSALGTASTANAYRPLGRRGPASVAAFSAGLLTSELPLQSVGAQALLAGRAAATGALRTRAGRAGLALTLASWAGLVGLHLDARRSKDVFEAALREGLGDDYRSRIVEPKVSDEPGVVLRSSSALRSVRGRRRYRTAKDVPYGPHGGRNTLDIWRRADLPTDGNAPVLVQIHGGAWVLGSKNEQALPLMTHMAERGWVCVAINYRLGPRNRWPAMIVDVKRALAWVKENIADHGGDPSFVVVTGGSAGGHLTSLAALTPNDPEWQPGFEAADTSVQGAVPFYGVYDWINRDGTGNPDLQELLEQRVFQTRLDDDPEPWADASPMSHVGPDAPPMFVLHGTTDTLVPVAQARSFVRMLRNASGAPVVYAELPRAQHAFEAFDSVRSTHSAAAVERFLGVLYGDHVRAHPSRDQPAEVGAGS